MGESSTAPHGLAAALEKAGPSCTASETAFTDVLKALPAPTEQAVAEALALVMRSSGSWDIGILIEGLKNANPALDWNHVASHFDAPSFSLPDIPALEKLMAAWHQATTDPFPLKAIVGGLWANAVGQLSFLRHATAAPMEVFSWAHADPRQEPLEGLHAGKSPIGTPNSCWLALDLYTTLAALADSGHAAEVRALLEAPLKTCPELLLIGAASVKGGWGPLQSELVDALVVTYVAPHPNSSVVLSRLWPLNSDAVLNAMSALHAKDAAIVARCLDVCQELKALTAVLDAAPPPFCLELAALAARREYLNLEKWLEEQFAARGVSFMQAAVSFLDVKLQPETAALQPSSPAAAGSPVRLNISVETLAIFLRVLAANAATMPTDTLQQLKLLQALATQRHPELSQVIQEFAGMEAFPPDVEEEANSTFTKMYKDELSVETVVSMLNSFKNSTLGREQEVFACMVHNLFDEFRFFFKYPEKELHLTAILFGQLVAHSLVSSVSLGIALRYVLEALRTEASDKMFKFGITAARQFAKDLALYPSFAAQLAAVPALRETDAELLTAAEAAVVKAKATAASTAAAAAAVQEQAKAAETATTSAAKAPVLNVAAIANAAGFPTSMPTAPADPNSIFSSINAETLEHAAQSGQQSDSYVVPDKKVVDRVHFVVNNITLSNVDAKTKELAALVPNTYHDWFVNYLVVKRAAQEPNFHPVYVALVELWGDKPLARLFVRTTIHYCKVMLGSKLLKTNSSERTLLKNLGAWLGKLTLARNKPVLQRDLDVKATIIEAYEMGRLLPVLSFVRNLLEPCADSKAFRPPNPWVMAILALLGEIYALEGLRTSHKFEVELLFKQMDLQLADVAPSTLLVGRQRDTSADNMDFQPPKVAPAAAAAAGAITPDGKSAAASAASQGPVVDPNLLASLSRYLTINQQLAPLESRIPLGKLTHLAVERAVVEIISPVVDRSVTIACMTAHELVAKDFAMEPDPEALRRAAHLSVAGLAQSLALVTAREPLRIAVSNNLRALLSGGNLDHTATDQVVAMLVTDNLDICCQVIERAAADRAQRELDERLQGAYAARARAKAAGQGFADASQLQGRFPGALPEALRARPGALTSQQQRVYQDFASIPRTAAQAAQATATGARPMGVGAPGAEGTGMPSQAGAAPGGLPDADAQAAAQLRARYVSWIQRMDTVIAQNPNTAVTALPDGHEAKALVAEVAGIPANELQAMDVAKNIFNKMVSGASQSRLHATAYAAALAVLREAVLRRLSPDATAWLVQIIEANTPGAKEAAEAMLRMGLLVLPDFDALLAKAMNNPRPEQPAAQTLFALLSSCVLVADPCLSTSDVPLSIDLLVRLAGRISNGSNVLLLVQRAQAASASRAGGAAAAAGGAGAPPMPAAPKVQLPADPPEVQQAVMVVFDRWVNILATDPAERVHANFVAELRAQGLLSNDDATDRFVRVMANLAVTHCLRSSETAMPPGVPRPAALNFVAPDAFVRLMVCLVASHGGGPALLSRILGTIANLLLRDADERGGAFNGRPYFRIIVGFLSELSPADAADDTGTSYLQAVAGFLHACRPVRAPGFAFPWLQLVADRRFMPRLLMARDRRGWPSYLHLLLGQLLFMEPFLRHAELPDAIRLLYKGTLRLLLVLLHDFPEFLCRFHFRLCDAIPPSCIQMRNLVLSAFPRDMRLPDPFTQDLKVDMLPEVAHPPQYSPPADALLPAPLRADVDAVLSGQTSAAAVSQALRQRLALSPQDTMATGSRFSAPLINALVFYVGIRAVETSAPKPGVTPTVSGTTALGLLATLLRDLDSEGRHLLVNALANHLRYPNAHTHYFSCAVLALFAEAGDERVQEQITRVLLERLIVNRPHPWGLLITFIELIKNPRFNFWSHSFTRIAPEIERLFESVARSCMGHGPPGGPGGETVQAAA